MRFFLLGATGGTGVELREQALERGHDVTAFVRSPDKIARRHERLAVMGGDPLRAAELAEALAGHEAVLSALGARSRGATTLLEDCARSTIEAMGTAGVRRLLVVSTALLFSGGIVPTVLARFVFHNLVRDSREMERVVTASDVDWTVVRPPRLTNGERTERYRVEDDGLSRGGSVISRADVAHFMFDELAKPAHVRKIVGVCR